MSKEAMKLVPVEPTPEMLKAMDECSKEGYDERLYAGHAASVYMAAIDAAPEQPAQQEPVAVVSGYYGGQCVILPIDPERIFNSNTALYTSPPAQRTWVGLTDEEFESIEKATLNVHGIPKYFGTAIEAKLKEKNNGLA